MKDNFSNQASEYSKFRPNYPDEMIDFILSFTENRQTALDVATGNGQVAEKLVHHFPKVYATEISDSQLKHAKKHPNIIYRNLPAEKTDFPDRQFDLITVAQAVHWFNFEKFYMEIYRILKPNGTLAILGYGLCSTNPETDKIIHHFYYNVIGSFWDSERKYLDENYETIPFPFQEIKTPEFKNNFIWSFEQLLGYLETWSAVEHYKKEKSENPLELIHDELKTAWEKSKKEVTFPMLLRIGKLKV